LPDEEGGSELIVGNLNPTIIFERQLHFGNSSSSDCSPGPDGFTRTAGAFSFSKYYSSFVVLAFALIFLERSGWTLHGLFLLGH